MPGTLVFSGYSGLQFISVSRATVPFCDVSSEEFLLWLLVSDELKPKFNVFFDKPYFAE